MIVQGKMYMYVSYNLQDWKKEGEMVWSTDFRFFFKVSNMKKSYELLSKSTRPSIRSIPRDFKFVQVLKTVNICTIENA